MTPPEGGALRASTSRGNPGWLAARYLHLLHEADVALDGRRPWDLRVHDARLWRRIALTGTRGLGDAYVDGWWDVERLDLLFARLIEARADRRAWNLPRRALRLAHRVANHQTVTRAREVGTRHYDLDPRLYAAMLDKRMVYTCAYWARATTLDQAQEDKLELVCRKLQLEPGMRVLDVGCGWGSFARYVAERHGAHVVGVTISRQQAEHARLACAGLPVEIRDQDYRLVDERFDRIVSLGMFEHVGSRNYATYMQKLRDCLVSDGLCVLQTVGLPDDGPGMDPWVTHHIFPNSQVPSAARLVQAVQNRLRIEDWHCFGPDYIRTLRAWHGNFRDAWPRLRELFEPRFFRLWSYYLLMFAGVFRARGLDLWQLVLAAPGRTAAYRRPLV
ncbi:MAG: cyclopropane fatty acyl phospholipid synthase [Gammaproteobacteria bacterium]